MKGIVKSLLNEWVFITTNEVRTKWSDKSLSSSEKVQQTWKICETSLPLCKDGQEFEGTLIVEENKIALTKIIGKCSKIEYFNRSGIPLGKDFVEMIERGDFGDFEKSITYTIKK
jgi:hypothetical protein